MNKFTEFTACILTKVCDSKSVKSAFVVSHYAPEKLFILSHCKSIANIKV